ncbi:glycosyltransferase family 39 protein [Streptomyces sp. NPDC006798]|uniref:glycosyltransferase family 39 protein n=1 Tax=Streptomyces sp. NPDC006798 TaxID=3155462 RepID=UPI00340D8230
MLDTPARRRVAPVAASVAAPSSGPARARTSGAWWVALPPALLMLALGLWGLERDGALWQDEAVSYDMATRTVPEIWRTLGTADAVHGLYYLLIHAVFEIWEPGVVPLRLPSVLAMCATAAGVAVIGRRLAGPRAGLLAGLLLPLLPIVQRYAQEGRSYALVTAFATWGTWLLLRRRWTAYAIVMLIACLLHEFAVLVVAAHGVTLWRTRRTRTLRADPDDPGERLLAVARALPYGWRIAACAVAAGLAPLAALSVTQSQQVDWIGFPSLPAFLMVVMIGVLAWLAPRDPALADVRELAVPVMALPTAVLAVVSVFDPLFVDRYVLAYAIGAALLLGAALDRHWTRALAAGVAAATVLTLVVNGPPLRTPESRKSDIREVASAVAALAKPGDGLLFTPNRRRVFTLAHPSELHTLKDVSLAARPRASDTLFGTELPPAEIRAAMLRTDRIVAVQDPRGEPVDPFPEERVKREVLAESFRLVEERVVDGVRVGLYVREGAR